MLFGVKTWVTKDGLWEGRYPGGTSGDGRTKYVSVYAKSYAEVKERLLAAKTQTKTKKPSCTKRFGDVLLEWLDTQALCNKPSTQIKFRNLIHGHIIPSLGSLMLSQITTIQLTNFLYEKSEHGRLDGSGGLSNSSLQALLLILRASLEYAAQERYIPAMTFSVKCPEVKRENVDVLSPAEQAALERFLKSSLDAPKLGVLLCLYTGLRIGEICALQWGDVDMTNRLIHVQRTVQRLQTGDPSPEKKTTICIGPPKSTCSLRSIPIPSCLMETLLSFRCGPDAYLLILFPL